MIEENRTMQIYFKKKEVDKVKNNTESMLKSLVYQCKMNSKIKAKIFILLKITRGTI